MKNDIYFWYSADYTSLYIDPLQYSMNLPIFSNKVIAIERIIPNDTETLPVISPLIPTRLEDTPYGTILGRSYENFLRRRLKDIYEYSLVLENGTNVSNLGYGVLIENTRASLINHCLFKVLGESVNIKIWSPERFYKIKDAVIIPTEHVTKDVMAYVSGLFIEEIFE